VAFVISGAVSQCETITHLLAPALMTSVKFSILIPPMQKAEMRWLTSVSIFETSSKPMAGRPALVSLGNKRAASDVVRAVGQRLLRLGEAVGGAADDHVRADPTTDIVDRAVVLADVDAVGAKFGSEGGEIVQDEGHACGPTEWNDTAGD
jgi:hypothetical protein